jgi:membrane protein DedA with SNARE-associated domain/rhodanese-related sulfurtransferase
MSSLVSLVVNHGAALVFAATLAARIGAPVPAAPFLVVAGGLASTGQLSWVATLVAAIIANLLGDGLWFWAGRKHGYRVLRLLCRISMSPDSCVRQSEAFILRWGGSSLIAAKFVPGVSVVAPPMAGALGMSLWAFIGFETLSAAIWSVLFLGLGAAFADQIQKVMDVLSTLGIVAAVLLAVVVAAYLAMRYWRRRAFLDGVSMPRIAVDELRSLMDSGQAPVVVDVRSEAVRTIDERRIPGAIAVELREIERLAAAYPPDTELVLYCNCPNEASAASGAAKLAAKGFHRARPLAGGLEAWVASGHAVDHHDLPTPGTPPTAHTVSA